MPQAEKRGRYPGVRPSISVRVSPELYERIQAEATKTGQSMAGTVAALWERVFSYERSLGEFHEWKRKHMADLAEMEAGNIRAVLGRKGWRTGPDGAWVDPNSPYGEVLPQSGFISEEQAASFHAPGPALLSANVKEAFGQLLAPLEARLQALEARLASLEAAISRPRPVTIVEAGAADAGERRRA